MFLGPAVAQPSKRHLLQVCSESVKIELWLVYWYLLVMEVVELRRMEETGQFGPRCLQCAWLLVVT